MFRDDSATTECGEGDRINPHGLGRASACWASTHEGGFTPFNFEITTAVADGRNSLVVEADATRRADAIPAMSTDWWNYGGVGTCTKT